MAVREGASLGDAGIKLHVYSENDSVRILCSNDWLTVTNVQYADSEKPVIMVALLLWGSLRAARSLPLLLARFTWHVQLRQSNTLRFLA